MAGGFNTGGVPAPARVDMAAKGKGDEYDEDSLALEDEEYKAGVVMAHQTLGGRVQSATDGDPIYMLGAFKKSE